MDRTYTCSPAALSVVLVAIMPALAQTHDPNTGTRDPKICSEQERANQTLSEKLDQTNGVICPPEIDPGMEAPTSHAGQAPVIPPPDSPCGEESVQPKSRSISINFIALRT